MDYYAKKAKANKIIDQLYREDRTIDYIEFKISTMFGFGRKIVENRIELLDKVTK